MSEAIRQHKTTEETMKFSVSAALVLFLVGSVAAELPLLEVVLRNSDGIRGVTGDVHYHETTNPSCTVGFYGDGNIHTYNGFNNPPFGWDGNQGSLCGGGDRTPTWELTDNGILKGFCDAISPTLEYEQHEVSFPTDDYYVGVDSDCILYLVRGVMDCTSGQVSFKEIVWTNVRKDYLKRGDVMNQGDFVYIEDGDFVDGYTRLLLQSNDGNLVLRQGSDIEDVLWSSGVSPVKSDYGTGVAIGYYLKLTNNGKLQLYYYDYSTSTATKYYTKDLHTFNIDCYSLQYIFFASYDIYDLVAVPCEQLKRTKCFKRIRSDCGCGRYRACINDHIDRYCRPPSSGNARTNYIDFVQHKMQNFCAQM